MSDQKPDPSGDILEGVSRGHEDQPGDLGKTKSKETGEPSKPEPSS